MKSVGKASVYKGILFFSHDDKQLRIMNPGYLVVDAQGKIEAVSEKAVNYPGYKVKDFGSKLICPGLIDLHTHLPQLPIIGQGREHLLDWLNHFTYPAEAHFSDPAAAKSASELFFQELIANGTTFAAVYPTLHYQASEAAFQSAANAGLRLLMGNVIMTRNAPDFLAQDFEQSKDEAIRLIEKWHGYDGDRIQYAFTPRFAVNCTENEMAEIGRFAHHYKTYIQTHLAETPEELEWVKQIFPSSRSYTHLYDSVGLLTDKTLLAHCIYLDDSEVELIAERQSVAVHCPASNRFLQSGIFPFRRREESGIRLGIGTDIAGGYHISMFSEMRDTIETSKMINFIDEQQKTSVLSQSEAFYYATLGAAKSLAMDDQIGTFRPGLDADFLVIDDEGWNPFYQRDFFDDVNHRISRLIYQFRPEVLEAVYVRGSVISV
ncbi:MAG: guanine deaminase [Calditrichaeota bacterium]|nr:guanine deaminase [Calditrichota bacterium]